MMRYALSILTLSCLALPSIHGQDGTSFPASGFASMQGVPAGSAAVANVPEGMPGSPNTQGTVNFNFNVQANNLPPGDRTFLTEGRTSPPPAIEKSNLQRFYQDNLFYYTWIDFGDNPGLRINRIDITNAWADMRAANFFTRSLDEPDHHFNAGINFGVQWWKEQFLNGIEPPRFQLPPVLYDLYLDLGWRAAIAPGWLVDLVLSPGLSTDFRITPPEGFRLRGHAITMFDMLPNLRGVLGITYPNWNTVKILPVAGFSWQATESTRVEAIFPQPRIVQTLGCWKGSTWEFSVGGEFGGGGWAFKNDGNDRETINYQDLRLLAGIACNGKHGQATLQGGYVFSRQLEYGTQFASDFAPGNAWMIRVNWDY